MTKKRLVISLLVGCILLANLYLLQKLLMPKHVFGTLEGSLVEDYYKVEKNNDVIFIGDCEVYENFSPITLWEEHGITSYIRGSAQQLIWQSYYLLEETLKHEKPDIVVFNVLAMMYNEPQKEAYNRMSLDGMKLSLSKLKSVKASMTEGESLVEYIFPLLRYHSRWNELKEEDFKYIFEKKDMFHNGYYMRADIKPAGNIPKGKKLPNYQFGDRAYYYLDKIVELTKENNIDLVFVKAPSLYPYWYDEWDEQIKEYAKTHDLKYINYLDLIDEVGIDFDKDTYDGGLHLNVHGAEKLASHFGGFLKENFSIEDRRQDQKLKEQWKKKVDFYYSMKEEQIRELEEFGYLKSIFGDKTNN